MYTMAPAYFEENLSKKLSPIYIGMWNMAIYIGPLLGFALSDPLINLYVDITLVSQTFITILLHIRTVHLIYKFYIYLIF